MRLWHNDPRVSDMDKDFQVVPMFSVHAAWLADMSTEGRPRQSTAIGAAFDHRWAQGFLEKHGVENVEIVVMFMVLPLIFMFVFSCVFYHYSWEISWAMLGGCGAVDRIVCRERNTSDKDLQKTCTIHFAAPIKTRSLLGRVVQTKHMHEAFTGLLDGKHMNPEGFRTNAQQQTMFWM